MCVRNSMFCSVQTGFDVETSDEMTCAVAVAKP